eukprot:CAMPEP_0180669076 /NCGR_PEP_ID=MMETSP1037_2-20121125/63282_1 /TAXON_ID=632150 /ORGANISM="Azadinium spinosum, Strain 3D9" /LENGTH=69 /DNA_ID=CAMNT_0022697881 /DNA_START=8 /DNA_END=213 /DNA_ORIENTATION=-
MARGCIPVVVTLAPMFVSVPFAWQLPWEEWAIFRQVSSAAGAADLLRYLLALASTEEGQAELQARRAAL